MRTNGALALVAAAALVLLPACSHGAPAQGQSVTGKVKSTVPAFCIGDADAEGTCFITTEAGGVKESQLHEGDCITVTYQPGSGDASAKATNVARAQHC